MDNFKEYKPIKKNNMLTQVLMAFVVFIFGIGTLTTEEWYLGMLALGAYFIIASKAYVSYKNNSLVTYQIDGDLLKYFEEDELVGVWNIKETEISWYGERASKFTSKLEYSLIIVKNGEVEKFLDCSLFDFLQIYNEILKIQGKQPIESLEELEDKKYRI